MWMLPVVLALISVLGHTPEGAGSDCRRLQIHLRQFNGDGWMFSKGRLLQLTRG